MRIQQCDRHSGYPRLVHVWTSQGLCCALWLHLCKCQKTMVYLNVLVFLGIVSSAMSFKMEVNKDMRSSASAIADWCRRVLHRCWNWSQFSFANFHIWTLSREGDQISRRSRGKEMDCKGLDLRKWRCHLQNENMYDFYHLIILSNFWE